MVGQVCVDANLPLKFLLGDDSSERALNLWIGWVSSRRDIFVPPLFRAEVTSIIRERVFRNELSGDNAALTLRESLDLPVTVWPTIETVQRRALEIAEQFKQAKAYDAQYLALAEHLGCELWTADRRMYNRVKDHLPWVRWVEEDPA